MCGECYLTGVTDDDLVTLCIECHEAVTNVRRRIRYSRQTVVTFEEAEPVVYRSNPRMEANVSIDATLEPDIAAQASRIRTQITIDEVQSPERRGIVVRRSYSIIRNEDT